MIAKPLVMKLALAFGGCVVACGGGDDDDVVIVEEDDVVVDPVGQLTLLWSIDGTTDPGACDFYGADRLELVIFDEVALLEEIEAPCEDFGVTVDLLDGFYEAEATLVDPADASVTVTEEINNMDVVAETELVIELDFPVGSFL